MAIKIKELIKNQKYEILIEAGKDPATGRRKRVRRRVECTESEAEEIAAALFIDIKTGRFIEINSITVSMWLDSWLNDYKKMQLKQTTWESYETTARVHIKPKIGALKLQELRPEHLQNLYNEKLIEGKSTRTVRYIHQVMHGALEQALKNQLIMRNVSEATTRPRLKESKVSVFTPEQQDNFLRALGEDRLGVAFLVLFGTGIRRGELLGLQWSDVDTDEGYLVIRREVEPVKGGIIIDAPKTDKSKRMVPLSNILIDALKAHKTQMLSEGNYRKEKHVFCTKKGTVILPRNFNRKFYQLRKKANNMVIENLAKELMSKEHGMEIDEAKERAAAIILNQNPDSLIDVSLHAMRHTFATRLLEQGENLKTVQELLGHARINITADTYSHVSHDVKKDAVSKMDDVLKSFGKN